MPTYQSPYQTSLWIESIDREMDWPGAMTLDGTSYSPTRLIQNITYHGTAILPGGRGVDFQLRITDQLPLGNSGTQFQNQPTQAANPVLFLSIDTMLSQLLMEPRGSLVLTPVESRD